MNIMSKLPLPEQDQDIAFSFWVDGCGDARHSVAAFAVEEAIFSLTRVEVLLVSSYGMFNLEEMLGRKATLMVYNRHRAFPRYFSGLVVEAESSCEDSFGVMVRVLLLPELHKLDNGSRYRLFQELSAPDIVQTIFSEHEISDTVWQLAGTYAPRQSCMQYGESDFAFVQRILGEEGIFYYFAHRNEGCHQLVLCDRLQALLDCPGQARLDYDINSGADFGGDVSCFSLVRRCGTLRQEAGTHHYSSLYGKANSPHLVPGHAFTLSRHPDAALNSRWSVASVRHEGFQFGSHLSGNDSEGRFFFNWQSQLDILGTSFLPAMLKSPGLLQRLMQYASSSLPLNGKRDNWADLYDETGYACMFHAFDSGNHYRLPQSMKPVATGPQKARVIAVDAGDEEHAPRCKVSFIMAQNGCDKTDNVTCWINVASPLGTALFASHLPEEGEDIIVDFLGGNPDQPVIVARTPKAGRDNGDGSVLAGGQKQALAEKPYMPECDNTLQDRPAGFAEGAVCQQSALFENTVSETAVVPLAAKYETGMDDNRVFNVRKQMKEWIGASRTVRVGQHQREDIKGVYELNCGEKYLCKTTKMNVDVSQTLTLRGPAGRVIIDHSSITLEAPTVRIKGRLIVEESDFERFEAIRSAIRDELPLAAECSTSVLADNGEM